MIHEMRLGSQSMRLMARSLLRISGLLVDANNNISLFSAQANIETYTSYDPPDSLLLPRRP